MGRLISCSTRLWCDNQSAIAVAKNPAHHGRTKHIDVRYHFIRELITDGVISIHHCSTDNQLADIFTKALPPEKHIQMRSLIGVHTLQSKGSVDDVIEEGRLVARVDNHGVWDHSKEGTMLRHGEEDAQHGLGDGAVPAQNGCSLNN